MLGISKHLDMSWRILGHWLSVLCVSAHTGVLDGVLGETRQAYAQPHAHMKGKALTSFPI